MTGRHKEALGAGDLAAYAAPALALAIPTIPVAVLLPAFYAETIGLSLAAVGTALAAARLTDVVTDPMVGALSDRWRSRFGRRKPMMALGAPLAGIALWLLFVPPDDATALYLALSAGLLYLGWTMLAVPYAAWGAELSTDYRERARITLIREGAQMAGILLALLVPVLAVSASQGDALRLIVLITLAGGAAALAMAFIRLPDRPEGSNTAGAGLAWRLLATNRPFLRLLVAWFVNSLANGFPMVLFAFFVTHALAGGEAERNFLLLLYFASGLVGVPLWLWLAARFEKHRVWCGAMIFNCIAFASACLLGPGDIAAFAAICVATGLALGADLALPPAIQADVVDYDTLRSRRRRAGLYFALWNMATKLALAAAVGIAFGLLDSAGFDAKAEEQTETARNALVLLYAAAPIFLKSIAVMLTYGFPIDAGRQAVIRRRLQQREDRDVPQTGASGRDTDSRPGN
jgi:Na+/melibiose symporter-like transporter